MIQKTSFLNATTRSNATKSNKTSVSDTLNNTALISFEGANPTSESIFTSLQRSFRHVIRNKAFGKKTEHLLGKSYEDVISHLQLKGKVAGRNYRVNIFEDSSRIINEFDATGKTVKSYNFSAKGKLKTVHA